MNSSLIIFKFRNAIFYEKSTRKGVPYIRIDGYCSACGKGVAGAKYKFTFDKKPEDETLYINVIASITGTHVHQEKQQQRGELKRKIIQQLQEHHGSAKTLRANMIGQEQSNIPSLDVIRQIKYKDINFEFEKQIKQKENVVVESNLDWYGRLQVVSASLNKQVSCANQESKKIQGFIQTIKSFPSFHMILIMRHQLECIYSIEEENRILHFDSTGGLVKIPKL